MNSNKVKRENDLKRQFISFYDAVLYVAKIDNIPPTEALTVILTKSFIKKQNAIKRDGLDLEYGDIDIIINPDNFESTHTNFIQYKDLSNSLKEVFLNDSTDINHIDIINSWGMSKVPFLTLLREDEYNVPDADVINAKSPDLIDNNSNTDDDHELYNVCLSKEYKILNAENEHLKELMKQSDWSDKDNKYYPHELYYCFEVWQYLYNSGRAVVAGSHDKAVREYLKGHGIGSTAIARIVTITNPKNDFSESREKD